MAKNASGKAKTNHKKGIQRAEQEKRRKEAEQRAAEWEKLSPKQQLAALDKRLGAGVGAEKQRAKIAAKLHKTIPHKSEKVTDWEPLQSSEEGEAEPKAKVKRQKSDKHSKQAPPAPGEYTSKKK